MMGLVLSVVIIGAAALFAAFVILAACMVSGEESRKEERDE